ncbi:Mitochondrial glycine transporter [Dissostichus eleginoides]|uniref:Mitochondrial glycine transporter n=1 Tax=Dissostichus eleginoides TaxID=100907 RepID=A0AAD9B9J5_DISEL|nr:Mitochondrial glycine transporter [Dissostichus eleginoides]
MLIPTRKPDPSHPGAGGGTGECSPPVEPLHFCSRVKGVLWGNIPLALPQPASTLNSLEEHSSSPALAFTGISWGAFLKPCPSPRRALWGRIPAALSLSLSPSPSFSLAPFLRLSPSSAVQH